MSPVNPVRDDDSRSKLAKDPGHAGSGIWGFVELRIGQTRVATYRESEDLRRSAWFPRYEVRVSRASPSHPGSGREPLFVHRGGTLDQGTAAEEICVIRTGEDREDIERLGHRRLVAEEGRATRL